VAVRHLVDEHLSMQEASVAVSVDGRCHNTLHPWRR
jgi:hypothetical protein